MKQKDFTLEFYEKVAMLIYAIAMADGKMVKAEKYGIKKLIDEHPFFASLEPTSEEIIYATLRKQIAEQSTQEEAFMKFQVYYENNPAIFSSVLKKTLLELVDKIASAYAGRNKSEAVFMSKLYFLFQK